MASSRMTSIHLPKSAASPGLAEWDEQDAPTMIFKLREYAKHLRAQAEAIEQAEDHEFQIDSYTGMHVQRNRREVQCSSRFATLKDKEA